MLPFLILLFCSSPETARMILIYATDESAARLQALEDFARLNDSGFAASAQARIRPSQVRVLLCRCGANNWKDDGRFANEYCCDSCGQFVEVLQHNDR
ncbi:hypothetical protein A1UI_00156 [Escherichia coli KTE73]|uniref:hypothetical protein n=1 Tax=Escherichia coli TaxID=562 RepID=UPI000334FC3C|nr:hypothetical protein [Escherichia coli]EOV83958.1 hypothetical protein A1UI_00156 [Escherichia coli KTE73]